MSETPPDDVNPIAVPDEHDPDAVEPAPDDDDLGDLDEVGTDPDPVSPLKRDEEHPGGDPVPPPLPGD